MALGITVRISHSGLTSSSILISDVFTSVEGPAGFRKAGPVYVPVGGMVELVYTESVARSFEFGAIRGFVTSGHVTAVMFYGTSAVTALAAQGFVPGGQPSSQYVVATAIVDSAGTAAARAFSTIKRAVAYAESIGEDEISILLMMGNTAHVWDGADSGYVAGSSLSVAICGSAEEISMGFLSLELTGTFPAANNPAFPRLAFVGLTVIQTANVVIGQNRQWSCQNVYWYGNLAGVRATCTIDFADCAVMNSYFVSTTFQAPIAGYLGLTLQNVVMHSSSFLRAAYCNWDIGTVVNVTGDISVITADAGSPMNIGLRNVSVRINDTAGTDSYIAFDSGAGGAYAAVGVNFTRRTAASTVKLFNVLATPTLPLGITSFVAGQFVPLYTVAHNIVDSIENAVKFTFSTIALAIAHAEAAGEIEICITLVSNGTAHVWAGASSGYAVASDLSVTLRGTADAFNFVAPALSISGTFPAAAGTFPYLNFEDVTVDHTGALVIGADRQFNAMNVYWLGHGNTCTFDNADTIFSNSYVLSGTFTGPLGGYFSASLINFHGHNVSFQRTNFVIWKGGSVRLNNAAVGVITPDVGLTSSIAVTNVTVDINDADGSDSFAVFDAGVGGTFEADGVFFTKRIAATGITLYNATATPTTPVGVWTFPAPVTQNGAVPATTVLVTVPLDVRSRHVYGDVTLTPAAGFSASWLIEVETGIGTGVYDPVLNPLAPATGLAGQVFCYSFECAGGRRYRFTKSGNAGTTETISHYSYTD